MKGYPITRVNTFFPETSNLISHHPKAFCIFQCDSRLGDNQKKTSYGIIAVEKKMQQPT